MARNFIHTNGDYMAFLIPGIVLPVTLAAWFKPSTVTGQKCAGSVNTALGPFKSLQIGLASGAARAAAYDGAFVSATTSSPASGSWHHIAGVFTSNSSRHVILNGGGKVTNTSTQTSYTYESSLIGVAGGSYNAEAFSGDIAEFGVWDVALTDDEIVSLSKGASPLGVRSGNLIFFAPLAREIISPTSGTALVVSGTTVSDHPRIYYPS